MRTKFVVRLLDAEGALLSWAEVTASPKAPAEGRASATFWPVAQPTKFLILQSGTVVLMTVHWCDLDVARSREMQPTDVQAGQVFDFLWIEPVWLVAGMRDVPLPATPVGRVVIGPPSGSLTAVSP